MIGEWLGLVKPVGSFLVGAKSVYDSVRGQAPKADFAPGDYSAALHLRNDRHETIIIERIDAKPPWLAFSTGHEVRDIASAIVRVQGFRIENALAVLRSSEEVEFKVVAMEPFKAAPPQQKINVTIQWRTSSRQWFSRSKVSKTVTAQDIRDLENAAEERRMRPQFSSVSFR